MESKKSLNIIFRIAICALILLLGFIGQNTLAKLKKPPAETESKELSIKVKTQIVEKKNYPTEITGYGQVQAINVVSISPEVPGKIVHVHPRLEIGEIIQKGDILFKIDSRDYETIIKTNQKRLEILKRNRELEHKEYQRVSRLFTESKVGTQSGVDFAEKAMLASDNVILEIEQAIEMAETNLDRCTVKAQFTGRVRQSMVEKGQFASPGQALVTLVDDSVLEIHLPLNSQDVRKWIQFNDTNSIDYPIKWYGQLVKTPCTVHWTEDKKNRIWDGTLHRIIQFNQKTRTITVAVRINSKQPNKLAQSGVPIVEGMFCKVDIPGKILRNVARLPSWSVSFKNTAFIAVDNRLKTVPVKIEKLEGDFVYVSEGLNNGDAVITTRLIDPLENSLLQIIIPNSGDNKS